MEVNRNKIKKAIFQIKQNPNCYLEMHPLYQNNEEIASEALSLSNKLYKSIPLELRDKNSFLIKVLNKSVYPFYRFTEEKKKDIEVLKIFFKNLLNENKNSDFYKQISEIEKKEIKSIFMLFPESFLKDKDIIRNIYSCCIQYSSLNRSYFYNITPIDMALREDKEFMLELMNKNYHIYESLIPSLKNDKDMMKIAMKESYGRSLKFFNLEYKIDLEFLQELNKQAPVEKRLLPNFLRADIGSADVGAYLESAILKNALNDKLSEKDNNTRRMKI